MKILPSMLILALCLTACATADVRSLTPEQAARVESIELLNGGTDRPYRSLGHLKGTGCQKSSFSTNVPENDASRYLKIQAAAVDADAVISFSCRSPRIDWFTDCFRLYECSGEAVQFLDR